MGGNLDHDLRPMSNQSAAQEPPLKQRKISSEPPPEERAPHGFESPRPEIKGQRILITGGTGSFGKAFIRTLLRDFEPGEVIVFSRDELKQFEQDNALRKEFPEKHKLVKFIIGDVRDVDGLRMAMSGVDIVIHAAAIKQVPTAEKNPFETVKTNIFGAQNVITSALYNKVKVVVALSTDKAANPINLYGATKLASDKLFVAANQLSPALITKFCVVRYGNVLGSRGSVVPVWLQRLAEGATSLPLTHPNMTRFWISLHQAVWFVLSNIHLTKGGEIFVPKIGAMNMAHLAKALGGPEIALEDIGVRPGEKLHETMITVHDAWQTVSLEDRFVICPILANPGMGSCAEWKAAGATPVSAEFEFVSDTADVISSEALVAMLCRDEELGMNKLPPHTLTKGQPTSAANPQVADYTSW